MKRCRLDDGALPLEVLDHHLLTDAALALKMCRVSRDWRRRLFGLLQTWPAETVARFRASLSGMRWRPQYTPVPQAGQCCLVKAEGQLVATACHFYKERITSLGMPIEAIVFIDVDGRVRLAFPRQIIGSYQRCFCVAPLIAGALYARELRDRVL
jgi:hypothetical protein